MNSLIRQGTYLLVLKDLLGDILLGLKIESACKFTAPEQTTFVKPVGNYINVIPRHTFLMLDELSVTVGSAESG